jgi:MFS family permease
LAAAAIVYAISKTPSTRHRERVAVRLRLRPVLRGRLGRLFAAVAAFEVGNVAATLLILRATELFAPGRGAKAATTLALVLYTGYNAAATLASIPAGRMADRLGSRGPVYVLGGGVAMFALAYTGFAVAGTAPLVLAVPFVVAGLAIGCVETAEHAAVAALAPLDVRGSAFGLLAAIQSVGNLAASAVAGVLWTAVSPTAAFWYLTAWMVVALAGLLRA